MKIELSVNGQRRPVDVAEDTPLLWVLREDLELTGTKYGCGIAQCGACTVFVNGRPTRSCVLPAAAVKDGEVVTIEGVSGAAARAVQSAWRAGDVPQCGYCQSGQIMSAIGLLEQNPSPSDAQIDAALEGNLCRCAAYVRIRSAVRAAARELGGER